MSTSHLRAVIVAVLVSCLLALPLAGCKYTDVLTEHIEDPSAEVDPNADPIYEDVPEAPEDPDRIDKTVSDADDEDTQIEAIPHYDPDAPDNGPTKQRKHSEETPHEEEASEGEEEGGAADEEDEGEGGEEGEDEGEGDELDSDEADAAGSDADAANAGGTEVIVDPDGVADEDPQKGTVAAVGQYATITQMLGGAGGLVAADEAWFDSLPAGVFPGELDTVQVGWAGDGTAAGSTKIDALINDIKPTVVLWDGVEPALSGDERSRLEAAGITVQTVPRLGQPNTEDAAIVQAITEVAAVLSGVSTVEYDPIAMRDTWLNTFHHDVLETCYDANGGYSYKASDGSNPHLYQDSPMAGTNSPVNSRTMVAYIDGLWHPGVSHATVSQHAMTALDTISLAHDGESLDVSDGVGISVASSTDSYMVLDYYLQHAGIVNNAYDLAKPEPIGRSYIIMPGSTTSFGKTGAFASRTGVDSALWGSSGDSTVIENWKAVGDPDFPAVLVNGDADEDIAQAIVESASKAGGLYNMESPYQVFVIPVGVAGNWAYGTAESFLVSLWALQVRDSSGDVKSAVESYVEGYYSYFYRCENWKSAVRNWNSVYTAQ